MKLKLLQILIIISVVDLAFLLEGLGLPKDNLEFVGLIKAFIYLITLSALPYSLGLLVWLFLSEKLSGLFGIYSTFKYVIYLILNTVFPFVALTIQAYSEWGFRLTQGVIFNNYFDDYISDYGFIIFGMLPTLIKVVIDLVISKRNISSQQPTTNNEQRI